MRNHKAVEIAVRCDGSLRQGRYELRSRRGPAQGRHAEGARTDRRAWPPTAPTSGRTAQLIEALQPIRLHRRRVVVEKDEDPPFGELRRARLQRAEESKGSAISSTRTRGCRPSTMRAGRAWPALYSHYRRSPDRSRGARVFSRPARHAARRSARSRVGTISVAVARSVAGPAWTAEAARLRCLPRLREQKASYVARRGPSAAESAFQVDGRNNAAAGRSACASSAWRRK